MILLQFYDVFFVKLKSELNDTFFFNIFILNKPFFYKYTAYYYITLIIIKYVLYCTEKMLIRK